MLETILAFAALLLVIGVTIWRSIARELRRTKRLTSVAPTVGLSKVEENTSYGFDTPLFHLGDKGGNRIRNVMKGTVAGLQAMLFDFQYEVSGRWKTKPGAKRSCNLWPPAAEP